MISKIRAVDSLIVALLCLIIAKIEPDIGFLIFGLFMTSLTIVLFFDELNKG